MSLTSVLALGILGGTALVGSLRSFAHSSAPGVRARRAARGRGAAPNTVRWATRRDLRSLLVRNGAAPCGRLVLGAPAASGGRPQTRRWRLATEAGQSVALVGPTQSGKTAGLAVPAILGWQGPVLAASVKTDLARDTLAWRRRCGRVWCFDPGGDSGLPASRWSPLRASSTWRGARRVAADLVEAARAPTDSADADFWYATAAKLLAPLLFAASTGERTMADVVRWVDTQEVEEVDWLLERAGVPEALHAAQASWQRDARQRSSVYTTAETVLEAFAEPAAETHVPCRTETDRRDAATGPEDIDPGALLTGSHTLYLCAPAHDQRRLRHLFVALVKQVLDEAFARAARLGGPLDPPLLVVLDEAANIAPLDELDGLAATCAGHGVQLVTIWQDLAQIGARYGPRAATVLSNHRARIFLSGTADPGTLTQASQLAGEEERFVPSVTSDPQGARSTTAAPVRGPLLPPDALRRLPSGSGVLVYGALPPARLVLCPWWKEPGLAARGPSGRGGAQGIRRPRDRGAGGMRRRAGGCAPCRWVTTLGRRDRVRPSGPALGA